MAVEKKPERNEKEKMNKQEYSKEALEIIFENGKDIELKDFIDFYRHMRASYTWVV
jgi:hypothetical protein